MFVGDTGFCSGLWPRWARGLPAFLSQSRTVQIKQDHVHRTQTQGGDLERAIRKELASGRVPQARGEPFHVEI